MQVSPFSLFVFHVVQAERLVARGPKGEREEIRYLHPSSGFMHQLEDKVQPALRKEDHLFTQGEGSAILFLPGVEQRGAYSILERIYAQVDLLEAETVIPPLKNETHILIGCGSYPAQGETRESLLRQAEQSARCVSLRPRIVTPSLHTMVPSTYSTRQVPIRRVNVPVQGGTPPTTPFLRLPATLPQRLTRFIPHSLAHELHCVPVGKDQRVLTVAMVDPQNREHIDYLTQLTHMTIFPVACTQEELDMLLATKW
ncbi:hypothetical protein [Ktedonospora formicarum]|uniref:Type II secretion system protein GspE N-terminal domain-containing protein n=1 Tax=Ktedonospora formicarum TaxID=2778364 RepID=A0A8J3HZ82_9CHLR|nr:hypothetical protein [Ktedonospora formicarum]GHO43845.1 hypothetical protein KSX_20080 [Ktedonospora formicarum]